MTGSRSAGGIFLGSSLPPEVGLKDVLLKKLDTFHLKGLRQILRMQTTYVNRANTNELVWERATWHLRQAGNPNKRVMPLSEYYLIQKCKALSDILLLPDTRPLAIGSSIVPWQRA